MHRVIGLFCCALVALAGPTYSVQMIQIPSGFCTTCAYGGATMIGINSSGQVAGTVFNSGGGPVQAFIGTTSGSALIPLPATWSGAQGAGINESGQVVGYAF